MTVPFCEDGSTRETLPGTMPLRVSIEAGCPIATSLACVSAIFSCALSLVGWTTLASMVPGVTRCPTWIGISCRTPGMPARTFRPSICERIRSAWTLSCWKWASAASFCAFAESSAIAIRSCSRALRVLSSSARTSDSLSVREATMPSLKRPSLVCAWSCAW